MTVENTGTDSQAAVEVPDYKAFMEDVRPIGHWHEWRQLMQAAATFEQKLGLLHVGWDVEMTGAPYGEKQYEPVDRLKFYFGVADGWTESWNFRPEWMGHQDEPSYRVGWDKDGNRKIRTLSEQRQQLAIKAFEILALKYFRFQTTIIERGREERRDRIAFHNRFLLDPAFQALQWFFRIENGRVYNLTSRHNKKSPHEEMALELLLKLPGILWDSEEWEIRSYDSEQQKTKKAQENEMLGEIIPAAKLWMIDVLAALHELDVLEQWLLDLDESCVAKLQEIAMRAEFAGFSYPVPEKRRVLTIDEACYLGSPSGWLVKKFQLAVAEHARLEAVRQAEIEAEEAAQRLERLRGKKA